MKALPFTLDVVVTPMEEFLWGVEENIIPILAVTILILAAAVVFTVLFVKKKKVDGEKKEK